MPDQQTYAQLNELEDLLIAGLLESEGHLHLDRQTADSEREFYFACREFRWPTKVLFEL